MLVILAEAGGYQAGGKPELYSKALTQGLGIQLSYLPSMPEALSSVPSITVCVWVFTMAPGSWLPP